MACPEVYHQSYGLVSDCINGGYVCSLKISGSTYRIGGTRNLNLTEKRFLFHDLDVLRHRDSRIFYTRRLLLQFFREVMIATQ
jgi:hypothetical protein